MYLPGALKSLGKACSSQPCPQLDFGPLTTRCVALCPVYVGLGVPAWPSILFRLGKPRLVSMFCSVATLRKSMREAFSSQYFSCPLTWDQTMGLG